MKAPEPNTPGARLRAARKAKKLSQVDLAEAAGFSRSHVTHMELNSYRGGRAAWEAVATVLGVSLDHLLQGREAGFAEVSQPGPTTYLSPHAEDDEKFADVVEAVHQMLVDERMPTDPRTLAQLSRLVWRDLRALGPGADFHDGLELSLSERRSWVRHARTAMLTSKH